MSNIDLNKLNRYSLKDRFSKVDSSSFATPYKAKGSFGAFLDGLPDNLKSKDLKDFITILSGIIKNKKSFIFAMGGHVVKVGLSPLVIDMVKKGYINHVVFNGSGMIHDFEIAYNSSTSENVDKAIEDGSFGMAMETGKLINEAITEPDKGLGYNLGRYISESNLPNKDKSILAACYSQGIPVTVHVAFGTDIIHYHPEFSAEKTGVATHADFKKVIETVSGMEGGAFVNFGSAVLIPEVFLKAITVSRNLGYDLKEIYTANFDFLQQYRASVNVVKRPTSLGGRGFYFIGHHEIMLPLLNAGIIEKIEG